MSDIKVSPDGHQTLIEQCRVYHRRLIGRAYRHALDRESQSVEPVDFYRAKRDLEYQGQRSQILVAASNIAIGAGFQGLVQNALDGKPFFYYVAYACVLFIGAWTTYFALRRR